MARKNESVLNLLVQAPWWVSVGLSATVYIVLKFILPLISSKSFVFKGVSAGFSDAAYIVALALLIPAPISFFNSLRKKKLLDRQSDINSIRSLSWKRFEELIAEAYRRKGYSVVENFDMGADGGVDIVLKKDGNLFIVQCKQWRSYRVDVSVVREMYGVMMDRQANGVIIVTSGFFTQQAKLFAEDKPIDLVDGSQVADLIESVQKEHVLNPSETTMLQMKTNHCPDCGGELVLRTARRGQNAGNKFWGCSNFPKCKFTKALLTNN